MSDSQNRTNEMIDSDKLEDSRKAETASEGETNALEINVEEATEDLERDAENRAMSQVDASTEPSGHKRGRKGRAVVCVETGRSYSSVRQASESTGILVQSIHQCLAGRSRSAGGYSWRYLDGGELSGDDKASKRTTPGPKRTRGKSVLCVETETVYSSIVEASKGSGVKYPALCAALAGRSRSAGGYHWKYLEQAEEAGGGIGARFTDRPDAASTAEKAVLRAIKEAGERGKTGQLPMDELDQWPREAIESQLAGNQEEIRTIQDRLEVLRAENQALQKRLAQLNEAEQKESEARILSSMLLNSGLSTDEIIKKLGL